MVESADEKLLRNLEVWGDSRWELDDEKEKSSFVGDGFRRGVDHHLHLLLLLERVMRHKLFERERVEEVRKRWGVVRIEVENCIVLLVVVQEKLEDDDNVVVGDDLVVLDSVLDLDVRNSLV